eukprot:31301-Pelagococcus_subviridis.AAC.2
MRIEIRANSQRGGRRPERGVQSRVVVRDVSEEERRGEERGGEARDAVSGAVSNVGRRRASRGAVVETDTETETRRF